MASKWRIDGVFWTCALKKWGQVFTRVGLLVNLYSVVLWEGITPFLMTGEFGWETFRVDLNENKRELDIRWKIPKNNTSWNISVSFYKNYLSKRLNSFPYRHCTRLISL